MLTLLVPILITYLLDTSSLKTAKRQAVQLHENSLNWLKKIGPKYPEVSTKEKGLNGKGLVTNDVFPLGI